VPQGKAEQLNVKMVPLDELIRVSDIVTLHCDLNKETQHLINRERLQQMKRSAYLVNTARGGLVHTAALCRALKEGLIAGAAIDVFEDEPTKPDNPLFALENVIFTPHMAGVSYEAMAREPVWAAEEVVRLLKGEPPRHVLNPDYVRNASKVRG